jgi:hypothetical protein
VGQAGHGAARAYGRTAALDAAVALILNFADGSESRRTLFAAGTTEPIGLIAVDGSVYARA